jgi:predicted lipoprotein with Yx(FWY)xxD motif
MNIESTCRTVIAVTVAACAFMAAAAARDRSSGSHIAPLSTPRGITLQPTGRFQGYGFDQTTESTTGHGQIVYADAQGLTLYTYERDRPRGIACLAECTQSWPPLRADKDAQPSGDWSIVRRPDGTRQWALQGKPLYRYFKDADPGSIAGSSPKRYGRGPQIGERGSKLALIPDDAPIPQGWHVAYHSPPSLEGIPPDLDVKEVEDAAGLVLVNSASRTLYVFDGDPNADAKACASPCHFKPVTAPLAAAAKGELAALDRNDGVRQWTYRGLGLYTFDGDLARGDANGQALARQWRIAYVTRDFMPRGVTVAKSHRLGFVLATADGRTLYRRDSYMLQSGSGHEQRRGVLIRPAVGRDLRADPHCTEGCPHWHPLLAPADARPQGYWDVYDRADGTRQWAFQGCALWTFDGDHKVGDINGDDSWQMDYAVTPTKLIDIGTPIDTVPALYWAAMPP